MRSMARFGRGESLGAGFAGGEAGPGARRPLRVLHGGGSGSCASLGVGACAGYHSAGVPGAGAWRIRTTPIRREG
jgi:hypothetical protein